MIIGQRDDDDAYCWDCGHAWDGDCGCSCCQDGPLPVTVADVVAQSIEQQSAAYRHELRHVGEPVRLHCKSCDHALFAIFYDPKAQGSWTECAKCGAVWLA